MLDPGNKLDLSAILKNKKFRGREYKERALQVMKILQALIVEYPSVAMHG